MLYARKINLSFAMATNQIQQFGINSFAMATNQIQQFGINSYVFRGLLKEHFCKTFVKVSAVTQK